MTHEQIDRIVRQANPVSDLSVFEPVDTSILLDEQGRMQVQTNDHMQLEPEPEKTPKRGTLLGKAAAVALVLGSLIVFQLTRTDNVADGPAQTSDAVIGQLFGGGATFEVAPPWDAEAWLFNEPSNVTTLLLAPAKLHDMLRMVTDPRPIGTGCQEGPAPADAWALAKGIMADPDFESSGALLTSVGGEPALRIDLVTAVGASVCDAMGIPLVITGTGLGGEQEDPEHMGLYLVDHPDGSGRILAIAIMAPETRFDAVVAAAQPVLDSVEFDTD